ncbi:MAG: cobalamin biosynthesis protein CbiD [Lachnospiraceae bacterium]|nr:cobalamin biosynthesis protein CbiD [Lachnospiraceae bacterium]
MELGYVYKNHKKLRCGYTTGTCAAAASKAAVRMLITKIPVKEIEVFTPKGITLTLEVLNICITDKYAECAVKKDAGDDADCTNGILVYSRTEFLQDGIVIDGGKGVGRITKPGFGQPEGAAAINSVPRKMITEAALSELEAAGCETGLKIIISVPDGEEIAKKTFNPRLGIEGGISILGTSGIIEPMSERALLDTIYIELKQRKAQSRGVLLIVPGNYGKNFARDTWGIDLEHGVKCSNFIGETLDMALMLEFKKILFIGHIGKLVKVAAGIMNTHSCVADARMETLCSCAVLAGCNMETARNILLCATTDEAVFLLKENGILDKTMDIMLDRIVSNMRHRTENKIEIEVIVFSNQAGMLAKSDMALEFIKSIKMQDSSY